jgi:subtilisin family serine protease
MTLVRFLRSLALLALGLAAFAVPAEFRSAGVIAQSQAGTNGRVRVIVGHRAAFVPEAQLQGQAAVNVQRASIASMTQAVLASLPTAADDVTQFETIPFFAAEVDQAGLAALAASRMVASIEFDTPIPPTLTQSAPLVQATDAWAAGYTGAGWSVAILDTGVDKTHAALSAKVVSEACYSSNSGSTSLCPGGVTSSTASGSAAPCSGITSCDHGTHVAGIAAGSGGGIDGIAKGANIIAVQVFSQFTPFACGSSSPCLMTWTSDYIRGLERVYALRGTFNIASVNMSLGGSGYESQSLCDSVNTATKAAIDTLRSVGIATVIASGNNGYVNRISSPGCISSAVSVGSTTKADAVSSFTNAASFLSLLAPGSSIVSSVFGNTTGSKSGTSMATPHVAGAWAVLKQWRPAATVSDALAVLRATGQPILDPGNGLTFSRIRVKAALDSTPLAFNKTSPAADSTGHGSSVSLNWAATSWADGYEYCVDTSNNNQCDTGWVSAGTSTGATAGSLSDGTAYFWQARASNSNGTTTANSGTWWAFTTVGAPVMTTHPVDQLVLSGTQASFSAAASGAPAPGVQWQVSTNGGSTFSNISGATSTTYSFTAAAGDDGKRYRAVFSNGVGPDVASNSAALTIGSAPSVTQSPSDRAVAVGATASFTAGASGVPTPAAQWQESANGTTFTNISGATSAAYAFTASAADNGKRYRVVFTNSFGSVSTNSARLTVGPPPSFLKLSPEAATEASAAGAVLEWESSTGAASYEYCVDGVNNDACDSTWVAVGDVRGATSAPLAIGSTYYWQVRAVNTFGTTLADNGAWFSFVAMRPDQPAMAVDTPFQGDTVNEVFTVSGWAVDRGASAGTGVDTLHVWAFPRSGGASRFVGVPTYGSPRPDIGDALGSRFTNSGFSLTASLTPGTWDLVVYAHSTVTGTFNRVIAHTIHVTTPTPQPATFIDTPVSGSSRSLSQPLTISGWAIDRGAASGTGVGAIHIWAFPAGGNGAGAVFLSVGTYGLLRPDVGAAYGDSRFSNSGYTATILPNTILATGTYDIVVFGHSTVTGAFTNTVVTRVTFTQ